MQPREAPDAAAEAANGVSATRWEWLTFDRFRQPKAYKLSGPRLAPAKVSFPAK